MNHASQELIPRVAHISAWPKHRVRAGTPKESSLKQSMIEKELTNNRIKIMNMKTDYHRLKKLIIKIQTKPKMI